jgi:hypothetical protein
MNVSPEARGLKVAVPLVDPGLIVTGEVMVATDGTELAKVTVTG